MGNHGVCRKCAAELEASKVQIDYLVRHWASARLRAGLVPAGTDFEDVVAECRRLSDPRGDDGEA